MRAMAHRNLTTFQRLSGHLGKKELDSPRGLSIELNCRPQRMQAKGGTGSDIPGTLRRVEQG